MTASEKNTHAWTIRLSSLGVKTHILAVDENSLTLDEMCISLADVREIMIAVEPIELDMFRIGTRYTVVLKDGESKGVDVVFKSFFTIRRKYFVELFNQMVDAIWDRIVVRLTEEAKEVLMNGGTIQFGRCSLTPEGVSYKFELIPWSDLLYQRNYNKLTINSKSNKNLWTNLFYHDTFNVYVMLAILNWIFKQGGADELSSRKN